MSKLVEIIAMALVDNPDQVQVTESIPRMTQFSRPGLVPCLPRPFADALQTLSRPRDKVSDANPTARYPRSPWYFPGVGLVPRPSAESGPHRT